MKEEAQLQGALQLVQCIFHGAVFSQAPGFGGLGVPLPSTPPWGPFVERP